MIRQKLEEIIGIMSDSLFNDVMEITTDDIRVNRISYNQRTSYSNVTDIAKIAASVCLRCEESQRESMLRNVI